MHTVWVSVIAIGSAVGLAIGAWAIGAGYDAWRRHDRAPVLDRLMKTWQLW